MTSLVSPNLNVINNNINNPSQASGNLNGKKIVVIDPSYKSKINFNAGMGPNMFKNMGRDLIVLATAVTTLVAAIAVGLATAYAAPAATFAVIAKPVGVTLLAGTIAGTFFHFHLDEDRK